MNYGSKPNNRRVYQPKTSITNQIISEQEKLAAETALRSLKQKMANREKKPIRQTNTANQGRRMQNYNNSNMKGNYIHMSQTPNYNNNMNYNYPQNMTEINKNKGPYSNMKSNINKKPITANEYRNNHNYNMNNNINSNNNDIYSNQNNYQNMNYNQNQYNINNRNNSYKNSNQNNNNYFNKYNSNINNNYSNNYKIGNPRRNINANANPHKNNLNINNYNNYNYNQKISSQDNDDDERPIGGGLTAEQVPDSNQPTSPCPHCGRSFNSTALSKHIKICEKVFLKKRKAYNAQQYRFNDSEQASLMKQGAMKEKMNPLLNKKQSGAIPKWKLQSMAFRAICNPGKNPPPNKGMNNNSKFGKNNINNKGGNKIDNNEYGNMAGAMNYAIAYGYKHCEFCNRNYNEDAYNKHLNFCKRRYENEKLKNKGKKSGSNNSGVKNQYSNGIYGNVKYNNGKYGKKK